MVSRHFLGICGSAVLLATMTGCNYTAHFQKSNQDYASRAKNDPKTFQSRSYAPLSSDPEQHKNKYFEYSSVVSRKVDSLPGINTAMVFLTDKNAYVGILTDASATGTRAHGGKEVREQVNSGTMEGVYNVDNGSSKWDNRQLANHYNSYFTHRDVADLSTELRQVIGETVRNAHPRVNQVYISANREYVNQLVEFAKASWGRKPLTPLTNDFNTLVSYVFGLGNEVPLPLYERDHGVNSGAAGSIPSKAPAPSPSS
ncbi:YhcN/YlaJ family sporulation lipoprotein [Cohnella faecalis]|uniref:Sporulation protein n=1 Tax=Cohnella faecalis TaxID=2315694 RepID=A0A398CN63_9BACL|nr:YhcN/YlaJ family sporulation lipoprotein [Cohnella faecalis]RIE02228.1 hypothetical protein D3H35_15950 [Cohnella faecalis]